jgi:hypothetical protein
MPEYPTITSKKIKYDSPSGFVNVGKFIPPFEPVKKQTFINSISIGYTY